MSRSGRDRAFNPRSTAKEVAASSPSPAKRKSSSASFSFKALESGVKSPKLTDDNTIVLSKTEEIASKDVYSKGSGDVLFSKGDKTAERVHITGGNSAVKGLYGGLQEINGVGTNDRPEFGGVMSVVTLRTGVCAFVSP